MILPPLPKISNLCLSARVFEKFLFSNFMRKPLTIRVCSVLTTIEHKIVIEKTKFVSDLKIEIEKCFRIKPENQRLVFLKIEITNEEIKNLHELEIYDKSLIKLVIKASEHPISHVTFIFFIFYNMTKHLLRIK